MILKKCVNGTEEPCSKWDGEDIKSLLDNEEALEEIVWNGLKMWHLIFLSIAAILSFVILLCCCVKFRIPRTKQEIEADYIRRKILRKFRKRLKAIQNQELDEMDLKKALDKIRAEFKSDTESLAQSDAGFSAATISSTGLPGAGVQGSTYRRASQIQIDISLEELRAHSLGFRARVALGMSRLFGRSRVSQSGDKIALTVPADGQAQLTLPEGAAGAKTSSSGDKKSDGKKKEEKVGKGAGDKKITTNPNPNAPSVTVVPPPPPSVQSTSEVKGQDKKKKETNEEKERKKLEKEKEKVEKAKLKIENEKLKKASKEKPEKLDKNKDKPGGSKDKPEDAKDKTETAKDKPEKMKDKPEKVKDKPEKTKDKPEKVKDKPEKVKDKPDKEKDKLDKKAAEEAKKAKEKADKAKEKLEKAEKSKDKKKEEAKQK